MEVGSQSLVPAPLRSLRDSQVSLSGSTYSLFFSSLSLFFFIFIFWRQANLEKRGPCQSTDRVAQSGQLSPPTGLYGFSGI